MGDESQWLPFKAPEKVMDLPADFDWRTDSRAANCPSLKEIRDQSNCGSCWVFGSVEAMTDRRCIASGGKDQIHLSAQDVTSCDHLGDMVATEAFHPPCTLTITQAVLLTAVTTATNRCATLIRWNLARTT